MELSTYLVFTDRLRQDSGILVIDISIIPDPFDGNPGFLENKRRWYYQVFRLPTPQKHHPSFASLILWPINTLVRDNSLGRGGRKAN